MIEISVILHFLVPLFYGFCPYGKGCDSPNPSPFGRPLGWGLMSEGNREYSIQSCGKESINSSMALLTSFAFSRFRMWPAFSKWMSFDPDICSCR